MTGKRTRYAAEFKARAAAACPFPPDDRPLVHAFATMEPGEPELSAWHCRCIRALCRIATAHRQMLQLPAPSVPMTMRHHPPLSRFDIAAGITVRRGASSCENDGGGRSTSSTARATYAWTANGAHWQGPRLMAGPRLAPFV
jgi:hypothetical protein